MQTSNHSKLALVKKYVLSTYFHIKYKLYILQPLYLRRTRKALMSAEIFSVYSKH